MVSSMRNMAILGLQSPSLVNPTCGMEVDRDSPSKG